MRLGSPSKHYGALRHNYADTTRDHIDIPLIESMASLSGGY